MAIGTALAIGGSAALGASAQSKFNDARRNQRSRVGRTLKHGRSLYGIRTDQALQTYFDIIGRAREATQLALGETTRAGSTGFADMSSNLDRQLAGARTGVGGVLAQSTFGPSVNRGIYSDFRRDVGSLQESIAAQRAQIQLRGAQQENQASSQLASALFRRGSAEFDMQQALAGRFGNVAAPQSYDLGELGSSVDSLFGGGMSADEMDMNLARKHGVL